MKTRVLHVVASGGMGWTGGIQATLQSLSNSRLSEQFEFETVALDGAQPVLDRFRPTVIIAHFATAWKRLADLARLKSRARLILQEHHYSGGFESHNVSSRLRFRLMLRLGYGLADRVVPVSYGQQQWMVKAGLTSSKKTFLIRSCRQLEHFFAVPPLGTRNHPLKIAAYGRLCPQKGFDRLIEAVRLLPEGSVELHIGGGGPDEARLHDLSAGAKHIHFEGRIDDVPTFLKSCALVVIPSRWEPWGNVCLEAKAAARPVIVSDVDGLSEQVESCGLKVSPDANALARAIVEAGTIDLAVLGAAGRASVLGAWDDYLQGWETLLREVAK